jgi:transposase-like protein
MWFVTGRKNGVSALGLQRVLGFGSYETAWTWLHKLRRAMVRPGRDALTGVVEVDETYVGGPEEGVRGRQTQTKAIVVVAAEESGRGVGRIRLRRVMDVSGDSLIPFVREAVAPGSVVHTDEWSGYSGLAKAGYEHHITVISSSAEKAHEVMPRVHIVAALLKRWLDGTHQVGVQQQHLNYYLDEFSFRFNLRHSKARGLLFYRLAQQAVAVGPAPYPVIIGRNQRANLPAKRV